MLFVISTIGGQAAAANVLPPDLNSRYVDEQPALSGSGRYIAFVSHRDAHHELLLHDLQQQAFLDLPGVNRSNAVAESPSISNNARYLVYLSSDRGRADVELYDRITHRIQVLTRRYRGWIRHPSISPDGRYIAFETSSRGQWDIEILDRGAGVELDLPDGSRQPEPLPLPSPSS